MKPNANPILIGVIAGLAAAVLLGAANYASFFSLVLFVAAFASIFVAGLGFGLTACVIAIGVAAAATGALNANPLSAAVIALMLAPVAVMSYLANLARPAEELGGPEKAMAWYPLSDILLAGAVVSAICSVTVLSLQVNLEAFYAGFVDLVGQMMQDLRPELPLTAAEKAEMVTILRTLFPLIQSLQMMIVLFAGFYFAMRVLSAAGRNARPREDIPSSLRMNRLSILVFVGGIVLMFAGGMVGRIGGGFTGAAAGGFLLSGFAILHNFVRGKSWALPGLILAYLLTFVIPILPILLIIAGGLANPRRAIALTPQTASENSETTN